MFRRNINMTPKRVGAQALICFVLPCYSLLMACMYGFSLHCTVELHVWLHIENLTKNISRSSYCHFCGLRPVGEPCSFFWIELQLLICDWCLPSGLDYSCWFLGGIYQVVWTVAANSCLVFASGLDREKRRLESSQRTISKQVHFLCILIIFLSHFLWWVVG